MLARLAQRMLAEVDRRLLWKFAANMGVRGVVAMHRFRRRLARGEVFPPVLFISVTDRCNLRCRGCWVRPAGRELTSSQLDGIIRQAKRKGNSFFGVLGGEPLLHDGLWEVLARHGDCYFQLLTNGTLIDADAAARMRRLGNVTPLISIEGSPAVSDERRGGREVHARTLRGIAHCRRNRLLIGAATSVCRSNIDDLVSERHLRTLIDLGVHYVWYYVYRPAGPDPAPELCLTGEQIERLRRFTVEQRARLPLLIVDAYWDHEGRAVCPAAVGVSHHVGPAGDVEPCPPIQFAADRVNGNDLFETVASSQFLADFRATAATSGRGCILMQRPDALRGLAARHGARDTSGRASAMAELAAMTAHTDHDMGERRIPERHWMYRLAKKHWFFGFGAYG